VTFVQPRLRPIELADVMDALLAGGCRLRGPVTYFVQQIDGGPIKIGKTTASQVNARLRGLQCGNPTPLRFTRIIKGDFEAQLHAEYAAERIRGEWFRPSPDLCVIAQTDAIFHGTAHAPPTNADSLAL
jgi:hypothetical protein